MGNISALTMAFVLMLVLCLCQCFLQATVMLLVRCLLFFLCVLRVRVSRNNVYVSEAVARFETKGLATSVKNTWRAALRKA